jgi:hypothetical protein
MMMQVVGGIVWCLEMCAEDVDVDFLFRENLNIGEKLQVFNSFTLSLINTLLYNYNFFLFSNL